MTEDELRRQAIMRFTNGEAPKSIYTDLSRTKQWFFKWLNRYRTGDPDWYRSKSHATHTKAFHKARGQGPCDCRQDGAPGIMAPGALFFLH